jgi:16S rRNA processing protein RimM
MIKEFIECGEIVGTHGVKGEVRVNPWCDTPAFLTKFKKFYLDNTGVANIKVISSRAANNITLVKFENIDSVEKAEKLRCTVIYIKRDDADLGNRHFIEEIIGCSVFCNETGKNLGVVTDVIPLPANDVWQISNDGKDYLIPAIDDVIVSVDVANDKIIINQLKGIFDDED